MKKLLILCVIVLFYSCHGKQNESASMGNYDMSTEGMEIEEERQMDYDESYDQTNSKENSIQKGSKIIRNGRMSFEVSALEKTKSKVDSLVKFYGAYFENEQYNAYGNRISYMLSLRIPNANFDALVRDLENGVGKLKTKNISARDVTEEYVDLNIRLENNLAYLEQYKSILKKAKSIKEILEVQEKIRRIEEEIESKKGRLKYLDDKVSFSTLSLELSELISRDYSNKPSFGNRIANAFKNGISGFLSFIVALVNLWPFLILAAFLFFFRKRVFSFFKRGKKG